MPVFERRSRQDRRKARVARAAFGVLAAVTAFTLPVTPARAGTYHVYSCRTPSGAPAPADGWTGTVSGAASYAEDTCASGGALSAVLREEGGRLANSDSATWSFTPPVGEQLVGATFWRAGGADGGATSVTTYSVWLAGPEPGFRFDWCDYSPDCATGIGSQTSPSSSTNRVVVSPANLGGSLYATATCRGLSGNACAEGQGDANGDAAALYLYAADIALDQRAGPTVSDAGGEVSTVHTLTGTSELSLSASDPGAGIYEVLFSVDGQLVQATVPDQNAGRCRDAGQPSDPTFSFLYVRPCPASVSAQVGFDTTGISNGVHSLSIAVVDAAGNSAPVLERQVGFENNGRGAPNGTNASAQASLAVRWKATRRSLLTSPFGVAQTALGRLTTASGAPIAGAAVEVLATPAYNGARPAAMTAAHTGADGSFSLSVPGGVSSRTLRFAYRTHVGDAVAAVVQSLTLNVRAGVVLSVSPHLTGVGQTIRFRGHLRGGPVPRAGKQVVLEARSLHSRWIQFDDVRSDRRGRFRSSYRFRFPGPAHYQFRAVSEPESDYPYAQGASNLVSVFER
jgi:hypothetical protein